MDESRKYRQRARLRQGSCLGTIVSCVLVAWLLVVTTRGADGTIEYKVKATFLLNFAKFISWPGSAFGDGRAVTVVGVLGQDPFGPMLDQTLANQAAGGRSFEVRRVATPAEAAGCHILFVSRSEKDRQAALFDALRGRPVLTVSEVDGFCDRGGMFNFVISDGKVKIEINQGECDKAGLKVSSKLLSIAKIVPTSSTK